MTRLWLVGGPSSVGKTTACTRLAEELGANLVSIDEVFDELTAPPQFHELLAAGDLPALLESLRTKEERLRAAICQNVEELLETPGITIIEGEGLGPEVLATHRKDLRVSSVIVAETEPERMTATLKQGSRSFGKLPMDQQETLVTLNTLYGARLSEEAQRLSIPVVQSSPMETLSERLREALS